MKQRAPISLANYVGIGNIYLIVVPLIIAGFWGFLVFDGAMRRSIRETNEASAAIIAGRLEEFFQRPKDALALIAGIVSEPELYPRERLQDFLDRARETYPFLRRIQIVDSAARVRWVSPRDPSAIGISRAGEEVYESIRKTAGIYWSPSYVSAERNHVAISFGTAADAFTAICDLDLEAMDRFSVSRFGEFSSPIEIRITDENGVFVSHPDPGAVLRRERPANFPDIRRNAPDGETRDENGNVVLYAARVSEPRWYVLVLYPTRLIAASRLGYTFGFFVLIIVSAAVGFAFSALRVRGLRTAFEHISVKTAKIADGVYEELAGFGADFEELRAVGVGFDAMVARIRTRERALRESERRFREILENIQLASLGVDTEGRIVYANPGFLELSGYSMEELEGSSLSRFIPPGFLLPDSPFMRIVRGICLEESEECSMLMKNGERRIFQWAITATRDADGRVTGATGIGSDITENRKQRAVIEAALKEKEALLREVFHRVKNNLQLIMSMLALQRSEVGVAEAVAPLAVAENRIRSMSLVHEMLYASDNFADIDFAEYAEALVSELAGTADEWPVRLKLALSPLRLTMSEAIPCGLILNEAVTNARKYAFPEGWQGERTLTVETGTDAQGCAVVRVRDTGIGMENVPAPGTEERLGFTIIRLLADQIGGELRIENRGGIMIEIRFPISPDSRVDRPSADSYI